jgi:hypothetical protein
MEGVPFKISLRLRVESSSEVKELGLTFVDRLGRNVLTTSLHDCLPTSKLDRGEHDLSVLINPNPFMRGSFTLRLFCRGPEFQEYDTIDYAYNINVVPNLDADGMMGRKKGVVHIPFEWTMDRAPPKG